MKIEFFGLPLKELTTGYIIEWIRLKIHNYKRHAKSVFKAMNERKRR